MINHMKKKALSNSPDVILIYMPPFSCETPPLGPAYLSCYLRSKGYKTAIIDLNPSCYKIVPDDLKIYWHGDNGRLCPEADVHDKMVKALRVPLLDHVNAVCKSPARIIGFSVIWANIFLSAEMARMIRQRAPEKWIIFGGPECNWHLEDKCIPKCYFGGVNDGRYPVELVDAFVVGEGEETLLEIVERAKTGGELINIKGAATRAAGYRDYHPRPLIENIDDIPYPTFEEFDLSHYSPHKLPSIMSRGCIGRCSFCSDHKMHNRFRHRSATHIFMELEHHINRYGIKEFLFCDLLINGDIHELERLCDLIIGSGSSIVWYGSARVRKEMTPALMHKMKKAGCATIAYGLESFSGPVLKLMNKNTDLEMISNVLKATHEAGIRTSINLIVGFPGESESDLCKTIKLLSHHRRNIDAIATLSTCMVGPGTDLQEHAGKYGVDFKRGIHPAFWRTSDNKNTYLIRVKRLKKILAVAGALKLPVEYTNLTEVERDGRLAMLLSKLKDIFKVGNPMGLSKSLKIVYEYCLKSFE